MEAATLAASDHAGQGAAIDRQSWREERFESSERRIRKPLACAPGLCANRGTEQSWHNNNGTHGQER